MAGRYNGHSNIVSRAKDVFNAAQPTEWSIATHLSTTVSGKRRHLLQRLGKVSELHDVRSVANAILYRTASFTDVAFTSCLGGKRDMTLYDTCPLVEELLNGLGVAIHPMVWRSWLTIAQYRQH